VRVRIVVDDLTHPAVIELLRLHLQRMHENSPPDNVFALDLTGLRSPEVTLWTAWDDNDDLMGCGALKELSPVHAELKSMRTADAHLRKGVAAAILDHMIGAAHTRGYERLSLETGTGPAFDAAHVLYRRAGFEECGPFGDYTGTDFSVYFTLEL
jgi:putative acetyltransferase